MSKLASSSESESRRKSKQADKARERTSDCRRLSVLATHGRSFSTGRSLNKFLKLALDRFLPRYALPNTNIHSTDLTKKMSCNGILSIGEVNALPADNFEWLFGNVIEHCPDAAPLIASKRPFSTTEDLKKAFDDYLEKLDISEKETVLLRHPDLAGKLADEGKLTNESQNEQKLAGLDAMTKEEKQTLSNNNNLYKEKFRFPFIICARENKVESILSSIETRLKNSRETELKTAIDEVKKICRIRIDDLLWPDL